jgi:feruloyl esterase
MDATDPNLQKFVDHGGKLLMYHGWSDPGIPPLNTVDYYKKVVGTLGGASKTTNSIRLFMIPGMNHCQGGDGTDKFDGIAALSQWVENGKAPERIEASHQTAGKVDRTRPLCPYPQVATFKGSGSTDEAANFVCKSATN